MTAVREICDTLQIAWQHWGYTGGFAVVENGALIEGIDKALNLKKQQACFCRSAFKFLKALFLQNFENGETWESVKIEYAIWYETENLV